MSRIGKQPILIPDKVQAEIKDRIIKIKGPLGELSLDIPDILEAKIEDNNIIIKVIKKRTESNAFWGLFRAHIANMTKGVSEGFEKKLEINGVGYRASITGNIITLNVGYSHQVKYKLPEGITATIEKNVIIISGIDKQVVGEVSAQIRKIRKPEPYKGKGIKSIDEVIRRKVGKTAASIAK